MGRRASLRRSQTGRSSRSGRTRQAQRRSRLIKLSLVATGVVVVALLLFGLPAGQNPKYKTVGNSSLKPRAVIVDQLSLTERNPAFVESAGGILTRAGYDVDYYGGEEVTVDLYRGLPRQRYDLVILRVHSGLVNEINAKTGAEKLTEAVALATGEPYDETKYASALGPQYPGLGAYRNTPPLFGITPDFVRSAMEGKFDETTIILMGCDGLFSSETAEVFLEKGAKSFVSWTGLVSAAHTDAATERLLQHLVGERLAVEEAVAKTMAELGPDAKYGSTLRLYPPEEAAFTLP